MKRALAAVVDDFVRTYERIYGAGSSIGKSGLEVATFAWTASPKFREFVKRCSSGTRTAVSRAASLGRRKVWWKEFGGFRETDAFQLEKLACGNIVEGPAIIEAYGTSIPLPPGPARSRG